MTTIVTKQAVREYIHEVMSTPDVGWQTTGDLSTAPAAVSAVVDPLAADTDPDNPNFKPQNRAELKTVLSSLIDDTSDDDAGRTYDAMRDAVKNLKAQDTKALKDEDDDMKRKNDKDNGVEEVIRRTVRKMLSEAGPYRDTGLSYSGPMTGSDVRPGYDECEACDGEGYDSSGNSCAACKGKGALPSKGRKNKMMTDVGGASFKEIAKEMGYASESGAKQAIEKVLEKARFTGTMDEDELQILVLTAMSDYISMLNKSGELTPADVELMKAHPGIVSDLDGFREFLDKALKKAKKGAKLEDPLGEAKKVDNKNDMKQCPDCKGTGEVVVSGVTKDCEYCAGHGEISKKDM